VVTGKESNKQSTTRKVVSSGPSAAGPKTRARDSETGYDTVLSSIRHNLRTPLNQIIGYSEMLQEEAEDLGLDAYVPDLQKIHTAGGQLLTLINDSVSHSRVESGKLELEVLQRDSRTLLDLIIGYSELCQEDASAED